MIISGYRLTVDSSISTRYVSVQIWLAVVFTLIKKYYNDKTPSIMRLG